MRRVLVSYNFLSLSARGQISSFSINGKIELRGISFDFLSKF